MVGRVIDAKGSESVHWGCAAVLKGRQGKKEPAIPGETRHRSRNGYRSGRNSGRTLAGSG